MSENCRNTKTKTNSTHFAVSFAVFQVIYYLLAVVCYAKLKDVIWKRGFYMPRANVVYTAAPMEKW